MAQETGRIPPSSRSEIYNTGVRFLDNGQNAQAALFFQRHLKDYPGLIEAADAFVEAEKRACRYDSALAWLDSGIFVSGWDKEPQILFLDAHRLRKDRDFGGAAVRFRVSRAGFG